MRVVAIVSAMSFCALATSCKKSEGSAATVTAASTAERIGCNHDLNTRAVAKHSWPFPADARDLRWVGGYARVKLKLRPSPAAFVTATVQWKQGELIPIEDSQVWVTKPRRLVAKRDLYVERKVLEQGIEVDRTELAVAAGEVGSFLFYNSRGMCMVETEQGSGWTPCTLQDAFEGLSSEHPFACEQTWWVKVRKSKVDQGWTPVALDLMERVPAQRDEAK